MSNHNKFTIIYDLDNKDNHLKIYYKTISQRTILGFVVSRLFLDL